MKGTLVLDGYSVMFHLCDMKSWYHGGGQYGQFNEPTLAFIKNLELESSSISPVLMFDGIVDMQAEKVKVNMIVVLR